MNHFPIYPAGPTEVLVLPVLADNTNHEISEFYIGVIAYLNPLWCIIICKHGIQFIREYRSSKYFNKGMWLAKSYQTTRDALKSVCSSRKLPSNSKLKGVLKALPERARDYVHK